MMNLKRLTPKEEKALVEKFNNEEFKKQVRAHNSNPFKLLEDLEVISNEQKDTENKIIDNRTFEYIKMALGDYDNLQSHYYNMQGMLAEYIEKLEKYKLDGCMLFAIEDVIEQIQSILDEEEGIKWC